jgi:hypothetical protein
MEPPLIRIRRATRQARWNRAPLAVLAILVFAILSGCQRAADLPPPASPPPLASIPAESPESAPAPTISPDRPVEGSDSRATEEAPPPASSASSPAKSSPAEPGDLDRAAADARSELSEPEPVSPAPDLPREKATPEEDTTEPPLPPPLVDDPDSLQLLMPPYPVWIDRDRKHVVMVGRVCQRQAPLELFACLRHSKEHESVVTVDTKAYVVHAGLLATGAEPGRPVQFVPEFAPPSGTEIEVTVAWKDEDGRRRQCRAQDWVHDTSQLYTMFQGVVANEFDEELNLEDQTAAWDDMSYPWVFAGSIFVQNERTGERAYEADSEGDLICVSNFPSAVLDVPVRSTDSNAALMFEAYTERIPPLGTPVTLILTPKLEKPAPAASKEPGKPGEDA